MGIGQPKAIFKIVVVMMDDGQLPKALVPFILILIPSKLKRRVLPHQDVV